MYVMNVNLSGTRNGQEWPPMGAPVPDHIPAAEVEDMLRGGLVRKVGPDPAEQPPAVEVSKPVAPELRARARRTRGGSE